MLFALRISLIPCCLNDKFYIWRKSPPDLLVFWYNVPQLEILMKLKDDPMAYAIVGCAMRVHDTLGPGFLESAYGDALEIEFAKSGIPLINFGREEFQYDTFDLESLPKSSVIDNQPQSTSSLGSCNLGRKRGAKP